MALFRIGAKLALDGQQFMGTMNRAQAAVNSLGTRLAAMFSVGAVTAFTNSTIQWAARLTDLSAQLGISVELLQKMEAAAKATGVSLDQMAKAYAYLAQNQYRAQRTPGGTEAQAFRAFGFSTADLETRSVEEMFHAMAQFVRETKDPEVLIGPLKDIFGRAGPELIEAFAVFAGDSLQNMTIVSSEMAAQMDELSDKMALAKQNLMAGFVPVIAWIIDGLNKIHIGLTGFFTGLFAAFEAPAGSDFSKNFKEAFFATMEEMVAEVAKDPDPGPKVARRFSDLINRPEITKKDPATKFFTDSLTGAGNLLGANTGTVQDAMLKIQQQQLQHLSQINRSMRTMLNLLSPGTFPI